MPNNSLIKDIKVIVWDLDGTLYPNIPELAKAIHDAFIAILGERKNLNYKDAAHLLDATVKIQKGFTRSLQALGCGSRLSIIKRIEELVDKTSYLKIDPKIMSLFQQLSQLRHILTSDTTHATINKELEALGLSATIFELVLGVDDTQTTKPDIIYFSSVLEYTHLTPAEHLFVGDRVEVDLLPAKRMGMRTCLVGGSSYEVDFSLPDVYQVADLFKTG